MPKFFTDRNNISDTVLKITGEDVSHIKNVLRMKNGDIITVCDGSGTDYTAKISDVNSKEITADIIDVKKCEAEPNISVTLFQALPKQGKMEQIIQKCTELGINEIVPVYTSRCVVKPTDKQTRWQKVAEAAAKQCGRGIIPKVNETVDYDCALKMISSFQKRIMLYECEEHVNLHGLLKDKIDNIAVLVGPEGGFDISEVIKAQNSGITTVTLGKRILRTETAAAAVLPIIMYEQKEI